MEDFLNRHADSIQGVVEGWDRILFRGAFKPLCYDEGMRGWLSERDVSRKGFAAFAKQCSEAIAAHAKDVAERAGRPYRYLESSNERKEDLARDIVRKDQIKEGLVCVLGCVEPCMTWDMHINKKTCRLELTRQRRKCQHFYFYYMHAEFGLLHVRLQSWISFDVQVCMNGRSYLQRRMDAAGIGYEKAENCFTRIDDIPRAQAMMDQFTKRNWPATLNRIVEPLMPLLQKGQALENQHGYYWSVRQSEYATDVMFKDEASLAAIYPSLCRHAIDNFTCVDILKFMGRKLPTLFRGEVANDLQRPSQGVRIKHMAGANGIKMYDKQGSVLRIETTINDPLAFMIYRTAQGKEGDKPKLRQMRKGVVDIAARADVSANANHRYLNALAVVRDAAPVAATLDPVSESKKRDGKSVRGLCPIGKDAALFAAVMRGEHVVDGFTNRGVQRQLFPRPPADLAERRRRCGQVSRLFRLLRGHGLIRKIPKRNRYHVTAKGQLAMSLAITLRSCDRSILALPPSLADVAA